MSTRSIIPCLLLSLGLASCHEHYHDGGQVVPDPDPRWVSIELEAYDPATNYVWEDVGVRILEADQEWSGSTFISPYPDDWYFTDRDGLVFLDEYSLAIAEVGFLEDRDGYAILTPEYHEDEALVVLELDAIGFVPLVVEVPLSWSEPDVFISVPFD